MQISQLDALTFVGPQISIAEMQALDRIQIGTIIVARPESEAEDQPTLSEICTAASAFGIEVHQIPVAPGKITDEDIRQFSALTSNLAQPVFAYCRSGMRATSLWALNQAAAGRPIDEILAAASAANFDLSALTPRLAAGAT